MSSIIPFARFSCKFILGTEWVDGVMCPGQFVFRGAETIAKQ